MTPNSLPAIMEATKARLMAIGTVGTDIQVSRLVPNIDALPSIRIYLRDETASGRGDPNHGVADFRRRAAMFVCIYHYTDAEADEWKVRILDGLFEDAEWMRLVESIDGYEIDFEALDGGETYVIEALLRIDITLGDISYEQSGDLADLDRAVIDGMPGGLKIHTP